MPEHDAPAKPRKQSDGTIPPPIVRWGVGLLAAFFVAPASYVLIILASSQHTLGELSVLPAMIIGGLAAGWLSYSRLALPRVIAWSVAGLGAGLVLEATLRGGLGVGTFITLSGIVLGFLGAVLGFRASPQKAA